MCSVRGDAKFHFNVCIKQNKTKQTASLWYTHENQVQRYYCTFTSYDQFREVIQKLANMARIILNRLQTTTVTHTFSVDAINSLVIFSNYRNPRLLTTFVRMFVYAHLRGSWTNLMAW